MERRLAAILAADMVGYSRLMAADETGTLAHQKKHRTDLIYPKIAEYGGRVVKTTGDGMLVEFPSVVDALRCAVTIQLAIRECEAAVPQENRIAYRVGINLGDIVVEDDDIYGDGVNVAARLEALAEPGGICVSRTVVDHVTGKVSSNFDDLGEQTVKNIPVPIHVFRVRMAPEEAGAAVVGANGAKWKWPAVIAIAGVGLVIAVAGIMMWQLWAPDMEPASVARMALRLPDKPSIAVLPFDNLTGDPGQDYFADGITETIISTLSRIPELFVIARSSSFTYKGAAVKVQQVAEELGVRYVLEGSVQRGSEEVRITVQLIDALLGHHIWSESYDRKFSDLFKLQDEIALRTTIALQVKLTTGEEARMLSRTTNNVRAWTHYQKALSNFFKFSAEGGREARKFAEMALAEDPEFADAIIIIGFAHLVDARSGFSHSPGDSLSLAIEHAEKAQALAPDTPNLYNLMQSIYRYQKEFDKAVVAGERAIELSPNSAISLLATAMTTHLAGLFDRSTELAQMAIRQSPHHRSTGLIWLGRSLWFKRDYSGAMDAARKARQAVSGALEKFPQLSLSFLLSGFAYKKESDWQRFASALRLAGLRE